MHFSREDRLSFVAVRRVCPRIRATKYQYDVVPSAPIKSRMQLIDGHFNAQFLTLFVKPRRPSFPSFLLPRREILSDCHLDEMQLPRNCSSSLDLLTTKRRERQYKLAELKLIALDRVSRRVIETMPQEPALQHTNEW